ncbi:MAG: hypothetical protein AB7O96_14845, partial [Pseudobdellovibrionaceae bacterium]
MPSLSQYHGQRWSFDKMLCIRKDLAKSFLEACKTHSSKIALVFYDSSGVPTEKAYSQLLHDCSAVCFHLKNSFPSLQKAGLIGGNSYQFALYF